MLRDPASADQDLFELQPLEPRILLSADAFASGDPGTALAEILHSSPLSISAIIETTAATELGAERGIDPDDLFSVAVPAPTASTSTGLQSPAATLTSSRSSLVAPIASGTDEAPAALSATVTAPTVATIFLSVATLPNGPPHAQSLSAPDAPSLFTTALTDASTLADAFNAGMTSLQSQIRTWAGGFNLSSLTSWTSQGLTPLSLPVVSSQLADVFHLTTAVDGQVVPQVASGLSGNALVEALLATSTLKINSVQGGYENGAVKIAASTHGQLLDATYSWTLKDLLGSAGVDQDPTTLSSFAGLMDNLQLPDPVAWTSSLTLSFHFVVDGSGNFLVVDDSALALTVSGATSVSGTATSGGSPVTVSATATADLTVSVGFVHGSTATLRPLSDLDSSHLIASARGTAGLALTFTNGPLTLTGTASYTLAETAGTRAVSAQSSMGLAGTLQLSGFTKADGSAGTVAVSGARDSATGGWTVTGQATDVRLYGEKLTNASASITYNNSTFAGSFAGTLQLDFISTAGSPVTLNLTGSFDGTSQHLTGSATLASANLVGNDGKTLFAATTLTLTATFDRATSGALSATLAVTAQSATFRPEATSFQATVEDGVDGDQLALSGSYDFGTQVYSLTLDRFTAIATGVFVARATAVVVSYDRRNTDPSAALATVADATVELSALVAAGSAAPPTVAGRGLVLRGDGFSLTDATFTIATATVGQSGLRLDSPELTLTNIRYSTGATPVIGTLRLTATTAALFADQPNQATLTTVDGTLDCATHKFSLNAAGLTGQVDSGITFSGTNVTFTYDATGPTTQQVLTAASLTATAPSVSLAATLFDLTITADGAFRASALEFDLSGTASQLGLGDFLPFQLTSLKAVFDQPGADGLRALTHYDLVVSGTFDLSGFKPASQPDLQVIATIGTQTTETTNAFTFTVLVDGATITPKEIGPITLGFRNLKIGDSVVLGATVTLGGYRDGHFQSDFGGKVVLNKIGTTSNAAGVATAEFAGVYDSTNLTVTGSGDFSINFKYGDFVDVQQARLNFNFTLTKGVAGVSLSSFALTSGSVQSVQVNVAPGVLTFSATDVTFNFEARNADQAITFGAITADLEKPVMVKGTAGNFAVLANGKLSALPNFFVRFDTNINFLKFGWPDWLPLKITWFELQWPDFSIPLEFRFIVSAEVTGIKGMPGLTVSGSIEKLAIDFKLLHLDQFPILGFEQATISVEGPALGGKLKGGSLTIGLLCRDAHGHEVDSYDPRATSRTLYASISATFDFASLSGFEIRIGLSDHGPLEVFFQSDDTHLLDAESGLSIKNVHADFQFNTLLPKVHSPGDLLNPKFTPPSDLSLAGWSDRLKQLVIDQGIRGAGWNVFERPMVINVGATLYSLYASEESFTAKADLIFDTEGRVLIAASGVFGETVSMDFRVFTDLRSVGTTGFIFLADFPTSPKPPTTYSPPPVLTVGGIVKFKFLQADGVTPATRDQPASVIQISVTGRADVTLESAATISVVAEKKPIILQFAPDRFTLRFEDVRLDFEPLGIGIPVSGELDVQRVGLVYSVWGAATASMDFAQLQLQGVSGTAQGLLRVNTSAQQRVVSLALADGSVMDCVLSATTLSLEYATSRDHPLIFALGGKTWFTLDGHFIVSLSGASAADMAFDGHLEFGAAAAGQTATMRLAVQGLIAVRVGGLAMKLDASLAGNTGGSVGLDLDAKLVVTLNTTSHDVAYRMPTGETITVPGRIDPGSAAGPYLSIQAIGDLTVASVFALHGSFAMTVTPGRTLVAVDATTGISVGGESLFLFAAAGSLEIDGTGTAGTLALTLKTGLLPVAGIEVSGTFSLALNTSDATRLNLPGHSAYVQVDAGKVKLGPLTMTGGLRISSAGYVTVPADQPLTFKLAGEAVSLSGTIDLAHRHYHLTGSVTLSLGDNRWAAIAGKGELAVTRTATAFSATMELAGRLHAFNHDFGKLSVTAHLDSGSFSFPARLDFNHGSAGISGSASFTADGDGNVTASFSGSLSLYSLSGDAEGYADSGKGAWAIKASMSKDLGSKSIGASVTLTGVVGTTSYRGTSVGFHYKASAWAKYHGIGASISDSGDLDGDTIGIAIKFGKGIFSFSKTIHINLSNGRVSLSQVSGATVFLDVNGNGVLDPTEPATLTDANGSFNFDDPSENYTTAESLRLRLGALARYDLNGDGVLDATEGQLRFAGGGALTESDNVVDISHPVGYVPAARATVWFDADNNGRMDEGEVATTSDDEGFYNFLAQGTPVRDSVTGAAVVVEGPALNSHALGRLAPFDTNANGMIDPAEGVFIVTGGTDVHTGLPNTRTLTVSAGAYGSISGLTASPLSELLHRLRLLGLSENDANARLQTAFGLLPTMEAAQLSARAEAFADSGWADDIETISKQISFIVTSGAEMLRALAHAQNVALNYADLEDAVEAALAARIANLPPMSPETIAPVATLTLDARALVSTFTDAATRAGLQPPTAAASDALATLLAVIEARLQAMRDANLESYTHALARLQKTLQEQVFPVIGALIAGQTPPAQFTNRFSAEALRTLVRATSLDDPNLTPEVGTVAAQVRREDAAVLGFRLRARDADAITSDLNVTVTSSNPWLIPSGAVSVAAEGDTFAIILARMPGRTGHAVITVQVDDGQGGSVTRSFDVTIVYAYAALMNDLADRAEIAARDVAETNVEAVTAVVAEPMAVVPADTTVVLAAPMALPLVAATSLDALAAPRPMRRL